MATLLNENKHKCSVLFQNFSQGIFCVFFVIYYTAEDFEMNPLTNVKNITKLNELELARGTVDKKSWHEVYKNSAWIFIGGLAYDLTEGDVLAVFSQYGEIVNINLVRDKKTGKTKGFCFLCYANQKSTILAVDNFNGIKLCSRTIRVDHVENYKPPKEDDRDDDITKQLKSAGCAPKTIKTEILDSSAEKKKKKKAKKEKKKHKKDTDNKFPDLKIKVEKEDPGYDKHEQPKILSDVSAKEKYAHRSQVFKSDKKYSDGSTSKAEFNLYESRESSKNHSDRSTSKAEFNLYERGESSKKHSDGSTSKAEFNLYKKGESSKNYSDGSTSKAEFNLYERGESSKKHSEDRSAYRGDDCGKHKTDRAISKHINISPERRKHKDHYTSSDDPSDSDHADRQIIKDTYDERNRRAKYKDGSRYKDDYHKRSSSEDRESNHRTEKGRDFKRKHKDYEKHHKYDSSNSEEYQYSKSDKKLKTHRHRKESSSSDDESQKVKQRHKHHSRDSSNRR